MQRTQPWFVGATLRALAQHVSSCSQTFTACDIAAWGSDLQGQPGKARLALVRMGCHEMVMDATERPPGLLSPIVKLEPRWRLTPKGLGTCRSVAQALPNAEQPDPSALSTRLWALLRSKRAITSDEAASTLIDAGSRDYSAAQRQISNYLLAWTRLLPNAIKVSDRRVKGCKRYVMVTDGGVFPPPTRSTAIAPRPAPKAHASPAKIPSQQEARV